MINFECEFDENFVVEKNQKIFAKSGRVCFKFGGARRNNFLHNSCLFFHKQNY